MKKIGRSATRFPHNQAVALAVGAARPCPGVTRTSAARPTATSDEIWAAETDVSNPATPAPATSTMAASTMPLACDKQLDSWAGGTLRVR